MQKYVVDTSSLMNNPDIIDEYPIVIIWRVLKELNQHKDGKDENKRYLSRQALRKIDNSKTIEFDFTHYHQNMHGILDPSCSDDQLIQCCLNNEYGLVTDDVGLKQKAKGFHIRVISSVSEQEFYTGYKKVVLTEEELAALYENKCDNPHGLVLNEYLIVYNHKGEALDALKWTCRGLVQTKYKTVDSKYVGKVKPINVEQELYMDMLQDKSTKIKAISGNFGSGKNYISLAYFLDQVERGHYERIVWIRNNIEATGSKPLGHLPGSLDDKLGVYAEIISDFVGEDSEMKKLISDGKVKLAHSGFIRGRDIRNSIIYIEEAQNVPNKHMMALLVSRCGANSMVFLNGDIEQTDGGISKDRNGLFAAIQTFKGHPNFAHVHLTKTERSETAAMANLLR